jgi:uncharacterized protein YjbJ (UPF0337 family)
MDDNRIEGTARTVGGTLQNAAGKVIGDQKMQAEGEINRVAGKAQRAVGDAADTVRDATTSVRRVANQAGDYGSALLDQVEEYGDALAERIDARPITSVLVAAGIGFLLALATKPAPRVIYRRN